MVQAVRSNSTITPIPPPPESVLNSTYDPFGWAVTFGIENKFKPEEVAEFRSVFIAKHMIADEVERLLAVLDSLDGDADLELNVGNNYDDPRLDDCEDDGADDEPSLASFNGPSGYSGFIDREDDPAESGIGDLDGMEEQLGRVA